MPLQNRVDPCGAIISTNARGTFMGNRGGALHNDEQRIVRQCKGRRWITCRLEFKGRRRSVMSPGLYTELFFLDEAVALAAGHRPCAECRRERFNAFRNAWQAWRHPEGGELPYADEMDVELHRVRIDRQGRKVTWEASLESLPDGCFVYSDGASLLVKGDGLLRWTAGGYSGKVRRWTGMATVLTPEPMVQCIQQGYRPAIHVSAAQA
jgi:hypothetical protein